MNADGGAAPSIAFAVLFVIAAAAAVSAAAPPAKPYVRPTVVAPYTLTQFWVAPDTPASLRFRYAPGAGVVPATNVPYTLRNYAAAVVATDLLAVERDGSVTTTVTLAAGFYEAEVAGQRFGVISQPPAATNRLDPFFAIDAAMTSLATFRYEAVRAQLIANLARGGITMQRERADWSRNNPTSGVWIASNRCDSVRRQLRQGGIAVLECFQDVPPWTGACAGDTYPTDLLGTRDALVQMAARWGDTWGALEVWNEPNLGRQPTDRWSAMLKAVAYGMREALPDVPCGGGAFSTFDSPFTAQVAANRALDAMDYVSFHTYSPAPAIEAMVAHYRQWLAAAGHAAMPLWLTEVGHPWTRGPARPPLDQDQASALDMTMQAIEARACGIARVFPFIYGYYDENQNDFGMMGRENTPLRSLAGYANLVRVLSHREFLGDLKGVEGAALARVFAGDEGQALVVLYTGAAKTGAVVSANLPATRIEGLDGRRLALTKEGRVPIDDGLTFAWVARAAIASRLQADTETVRLYRLSRQPAPTRTPLSPLVLRCVADPRHTRVSGRGYDVPDPFDGHYAARVRLFNLGSNACRAEVRASVSGTNLSLRRATVDVPARAFTNLSWTLDLSRSRLAAEGAADLVFDATAADGRGDRLSLHLMRPVGIDVLLAHRPLRLETPVRAVELWRANVAPGGTMTFAPLPEGGMRVDADFGSAAGKGGWAYPRFFGLPPLGSMRGVQGVVIRGRIDGDGTVRMFATEKQTDAKYIHVSPMFPADGQWHNVFVSFQDFTPFTGADPDNRLDPDQLAHVEIGCNTRARHCVIEIAQLWFVGEEAP